jgi:hypothetical protein
MFAHNPDGATPRPRQQHHRQARRTRSAKTRPQAFRYSLTTLSGVRRVYAVGVGQVEGPPPEPVLRPERFPTLRMPWEQGPQEQEPDR